VIYKITGEKSGSDDEMKLEKQPFDTWPV